MSRGIAGEGAQVVTYGLASTPAMFNSTISEDPEILCPADGAIMITGTKLICCTLLLPQFCVQFSVGSCRQICF